MDTLIIAACTFVAGIGLSGLGFYIKSLTNRIVRLEAAQAKHLPYRSADEIEDATAAILRIRHEAQFNLDLVDNAMAHLQMARNPKPQKKASRDNEAG